MGDKTVASEFSKVSYLKLLSDSEWIEVAEENTASRPSPAGGDEAKLRRSASHLLFKDSSGTHRVTRTESGFVDSITLPSLSGVVDISPNGRFVANAHLLIPHGYGSLSGGIYDLQTGTAVQSLDVDRHWDVQFHGDDLVNLKTEYEEQYYKFNGSNWVQFDFETRGLSRTAIRLSRDFWREQLAVTGLTSTDYRHSL